MRVAGYIFDRLSGISFSLLAFLATVAAVGLEFRYDYVEHALGRYLAWHNQGRQEFGQIWENVAVSENVQERLDNLVRDRRRQEVVDESIGEISQLLDLASTRERLILTRERFLQVYSALPYCQSSLLIDPLQLLDLAGKLPAWQRTLAVFEEGSLNLYLVDGLNNVLHKLSLSPGYVAFFMSDKDTRQRQLDAIPTFSPPFYPADVFFEAMVRLSPEERAGIPISPRELLSWRFRLQRVGVTREASIDDRTELGFELTGDEGVTTVRMLGRNPSVISLAGAMHRLLQERYPERMMQQDSLGAPAPARPTVSP
jgi:hypothetical protein